MPVLVDCTPEAMLLAPDADANLPARRVMAPQVINSRLQPNFCTNVPILGMMGADHLAPVTSGRVKVRDDEDSRLQDSSRLVAMRGGVTFVMLPEQVLAVIIAVECAHDAVHVLLHRLLPVGTGQADRALMVKLDQDHGAVHPVVEDPVGLRPSDPALPAP